MRNALAVVVAALASSGCISPPHLTYDHGRAFTDAFVGQPDLTRPSVTDSQYNLYGIEAEQIRIQVQQSSTDEESAESTVGDASN